MKVRDLAIMCYEATRALPDNRHMPMWPRLPTADRDMWDTIIKSRLAGSPVTKGDAGRTLEALCALFKDSIEDA